MEASVNSSLKNKLAMALSACAAFAFVIAPALHRGPGVEKTEWAINPEALSAKVELMKLNAGSAERLAREFNRFSYSWPPADTGLVPPIEVTRLPENLDNMVVKTKKSIFFRTLLPLVLAENSRIEAQREWIISLFEKGRLVEGTPEWRSLEKMAGRYHVKGDLNSERTRKKLLQRVDVIPVGLVLAQAAMESGWGTSRFALEGNSLFGEWTWRKGAGLKPSRRDEGAGHSVKAFPDLRASVRSYMRNLNVGFAYGKLRRMREEMRAKDQPLDPVLLAGGLVRYSQRGERYVKEIRRMIKTNGLERLAPTNLAIGVTPMAQVKGTSRAGS